MIGHVGHVGQKVSALIDGQLPAAESDRLWAHVHTCGACRDLVEREGWVKTRLAGLALCGSQPTAPNYLRSVLCEPDGLEDGSTTASREHERRRAMVVVLGAGSVGAALCGVLALALPAQSPPVDPRGPVTSISTPTGSARTAPTFAPGAAGGFVSARLGRDAPVPSAPGARTSSEMARLSLPLAR